MDSDQGTEAHHLPWHRSTFPGQSLHIFAVTSRQQLPKSSSNSHVNVVAIILSATHNHSPTWASFCQRISAQHRVQKFGLVFFLVPSLLMESPAMLSVPMSRNHRGLKGTGQLPPSKDSKLLRALLARYCYSNSCPLEEVLRTEHGD